MPWWFNFVAGVFVGAFIFNKKFRDTVMNFFSKKKKKAQDKK